MQAILTDVTLYGRFLTTELIDLLNIFFDIFLSPSGTRRTKGYPKEKVTIMSSSVQFWSFVLSISASSCCDQLQFQVNSRFCCFILLYHLTLLQSLI